MRMPMLAALAGCFAMAAGASAQIVYLSQTRVITVTTSADGQTSSRAAGDLGEFTATVSRSLPVVVDNIPGVNAGTTDISCHFDRNALAATVRLQGQGVIGPVNQVTARATALVDTIFMNQSEATYRLISNGLNILAPGANFISVRVSDLDQNRTLFDRAGADVVTNLVGTLPVGRYRFEFFAELTSIEGACGREYEVELDVPAEPCAADLDDGTFTGARDGAVTIDDLLFFLDAYSRGDLRADLDDGSGRGGNHPDGAVTIDDLLYFMEHYAMGC